MARLLTTGAGSALSRRSFLEIAALAGGVVALRQFTGGVRPALASPQNPQLFLFVYFEGAWDQLLAFDPRDNTNPRFRRDAAYAQNGSGVYPAYDTIPLPEIQTLLKANPSGVQRAGNLSFGPAIPPSLLAHAGDLCVVRGINMDTLTHEVGRRYFLTGKFPRGLVASGSSMTTAVAAAEGMATTLPNLAIGTEAYNETFPPYASPIRVTAAADMLNVLRPIGTPLSATSQQALQAFEATADSCAAHERDGDKLVSFFRASRQRSRSLTDAGTATLFQFNPVAPPPEVQPLFKAMQINSYTDLAGPKGRAALAAQALQHGVSQAVSVVLATGIDDHFDWAQDHPTSLRAAFDALGLLIAQLKSVPYKNGKESVWAHTTMVVFSEFARTPLINTRDGRDHHLSSSCVAAGPGLRGNTVIGATTDEHMVFQPLDLKSGRATPNGITLRPSDVHATVLKSMGIAYDHIANQSPQIVEAMLK